MLGREPGRYFWTQPVKVFSATVESIFLYHLILNVLLIFVFVGRRLCLCSESLIQNTSFYVFRLELWKYIWILSNELVFMCVCLCVLAQAFSLPFCFTILSVGLWLCSCKMMFGTLVITFMSKTERKGKESSIHVSSLLSGKKKLAQKLSQQTSS